MTKMKKNQFTALSLACCLSLLTACGSDNRNTSSLDDLNKALDVASSTMDTFEGNGDKVNKDNAMDVFSSDYASNLNKDQALAHLAPMGVKPEADGSFTSYADTNNNQIKDADEKSLFKLEVDAENNRLIASSENGVSEQPRMGMGTGFLMGMLMSNMMSRQRATGANPAARKATPRRAAPSARSKSGSGSHASGK